MTCIALREKAENSMRALNESVKAANAMLADSLRYERELKLFIETIKKKSI